MKVRKVLVGSLCLATLALCTAPRATQAPKMINITASRFAYDPKEITVNKGEEVTLLITSTDVTHGLVIEALGVSANDTKKGKTTAYTFNPGTVGTFQGKCSHFCGSGHGSMKLTVNVVEHGVAP